MADQATLGLAPALVDDLNWYPLFRDRVRGTTWALGSLSRDSYLSVPDQSRAVVEDALRLMDGTRTIEAVNAELARRWDAVDVATLTHTMASANLLADDAPHRRPRSEYETLALRLASWRVSRDNLLLRLLAAAWWPLVLAALTLIAWVVVSGALVGRVTTRTYFQFAGDDWSHWAALVLVSVASVGLHELAHAVAARRCGLYASRVTVSLYLYLSPIVYVSIPGLYSIPRARRVLVWAAGPFLNLVLASACVAAAPHVGGWGQTLLEAGVFVNLLLIAVNLFPFLPLDGYFIAATLLKVTNLRRQALSLRALHRSDRLALGARLLLWGYALITWATMAYLVGREAWGMVHTAWVTYAASADLLATLDAVKTYLMVLAVIAAAVFARRSLAAPHRKEAHGNPAR
nr:M50 family metallopeptidase [Propionibacterium sp.]